MRIFVKIFLLFLTLQPLFAGNEVLKWVNEFFKTAYGNGTLTYKSAEERNCTILFKKVLYTAKGKKLAIDTLLVPKKEKPLKWIYTEGEKLFKKGKMSSTVEKSYTVSTGDAIFIEQKGVKFFKNSTEPYITSENFAIDILFSENGLAVDGKGFVKIPQLFKENRFLSLEGFVNAFKTKAVGLLKVYLEGYFEAKAKLGFENVDLKSVRKALKGDKKAGEKIFDIVPKYTELSITFGEEALSKIRARKREIEREVKPYLSEKGLLGQLSRSLKAIAEGKAEGLKVVVENRAELNISQLVMLFLMLSMAKDEKQIEQILQNYLTVRISAI